MKIDKRKRLFLCLGAFVAYIFLFRLFYGPLPGSIIVFILLPVGLSAYWLGITGGIVAGLLTLPVDLALFYSLGLEIFLETLSQPVFWVGHGVFLLFGALIGYYQELRARLQHELDTRQRLEGVIRQSEAFYRGITEQSTDIILIINQDLQVNYISPTVTRIAGFEPDELLGHLSELFPDADEISRFEEIIEQLSERPGAAAVIPKVRFRHKSGDGLYLEAILTNMFHVRDVNGILVNARDVTDRVATEQELTESEERYSQIISLSPIAIAVCRAGKFAYLNPAGIELFGAQHAAQIVGRPIMDFVHPDDHEEVSATIKDLLAEAREYVHREERLVRVDGEIIQGEVSAAPIHFDGAPAVQILIRDVTDQIHAKAALQESEARFRALFEQNNDGVILLNLDGTILDMNPSFCRWTGLRADSMRGQDIRNLLPTERQPEANAVLDSLIKKDSAPIFELEFPTAKGEVHPVEITFSVARSQDGKARFIQCFARDVSDRKRAEMLLKDKERRYRSLFEQNNDAIFLFKDSKILDLNPRAAEMHGYEMEELRGQTFEVLTAPEQLADAEEAYQKLINGRSLPIYERKVRRKDGSTFYVEINACGVYDPNGDLLYIQSIARDVSERQEAQQALQESHRRFQALMQQSNDAIFISDLDNTIINTNQHAADLLGLPMDQVRDRRLSDFLVQESEDNSLATVHLAAKGSNLPIYERTLRMADGTLRIVEVNATLVRDHNGQPIYVQRIVRDITARKEAERQLEQKASRDQLTGLLNRRSFFELLEAKLAELEQTNTVSALLFIDLDRFKPVNDIYGHHAGDFVLRTVANRLKVCTRQSDLMARLGGDEFVVWLDNAKSESIALLVANRISSSIAEPTLFENRQIEISSSIGLSMAPMHAKGADELVSRADQAMYLAKKSRENRVVVYSE